MLFVGDGKHRREGPCVGTKALKLQRIKEEKMCYLYIERDLFIQIRIPGVKSVVTEVLFRSLHQGPKADIWSAGVTLLYLMIGRAPFIGDTDQNIKEIATLRGSEDLWEVAKLHNHESLFPTELLDVKYLSPVKLRDWCARNTRRPDFLKNIPASLFDLVDKCLMVNPRQRISAEEALRHQFFTPCHEALRKHRLERGINRESGSTH
ncbi:UNVERIFIED_CONTAM: Cell cycle serine/threonine-protein kinase hsk1 [Sesamum calycinum]|uniref:non-specific serine/threonine protein kinase n=1 Tax=Sesamum calycinum TaxID=2727403 RepID=A0AAW2QY98_9LAMI